MGAGKEASFLFVCLFFPWKSERMCVSLGYILKSSTSSIHWHLCACMCVCVCRCGLSWPIPPTSTWARWRSGRWATTCRPACRPSSNHTAHRCRTCAACNDIPGTWRELRRTRCLATLWLGYLPWSRRLHSPLIPSTCRFHRTIIVVGVAV